MINLLRYSAAFMLIGRAYEHIRWGGPFRDIFYHPDGFGGWYANLINRPLKEIYNDHFYETALSYFSDGIGVIFLLTAVLILFFERLQKFKSLIFISTGCLALTFFGFLYGKNLAQIGMFFEHSAQLASPLLFLWSYQRKNDKVVWWATVSIAITFLCHGLYAYGYYPQPGNFADMMILGFGLTEDFSRELLIIIGILDFVFAAIAIGSLISFVIPLNHIWVRRILQINLWYAILWGFLTALARLYTSYTEGMFLHWADQYWLEFMVRIPHFIIPYVLLKKLYK